MTEWIEELRERVMRVLEAQAVGDLMKPDIREGAETNDLGRRLDARRVDADGGRYRIFGRPRSAGESAPAGVEQRLLQRRICDRRFAKGHVDTGGDVRKHLAIEVLPVSLREIVYAVLIDVLLGEPEGQGLRRPGIAADHAVGDRVLRRTDALVGGCHRRFPIQPASIHGRI
ncbi:hypothetical protein [Sinorhizobium fredii]|uniref:hypothetical protein n=1 Tax=Rhizobium fredii TaxID=380 RepID=UPI001FCA52CE|nr:hypothetical protein [Sinorhizobium fredii]